MSHFCKNHLTVIGSPEEIQNFKAKAIGHEPWDEPKDGQEPSPLNFHSLVPVPDEVLKGGEDAGQEWQVEHWGCKWSASEFSVYEEGEAIVHYLFLTPSDPPIRFVESVARAWPNLTFILEYAEIAMGYKGLGKFKAGESEHLYINYHEMLADHEA
jgi:hypothetical protein